MVCVEGQVLLSRATVCHGTFPARDGTLSKFSSAKSPLRTICSTVYLPSIGKTQECFGTFPSLFRPEVDRKSRKSASGAARLRRAPPRRPQLTRTAAVNMQYAPLVFFVAVQWLAPSAYSSQCRILYLLRNVLYKCHNRLGSRSHLHA